MRLFFTPVILCTLLLSVINGNSQTLVKPFGIKICGPEFGENKLPGVYGTDYIYPNYEELSYFFSKGFRLIDLPFRWERIQPVLGVALDSAELNRMQMFLNECDSIGLQVKLTMQNFGRYRCNGNEYIIGSKELPVSYFDDVWKKLAFAFRNQTNIYGFQIMNEPYKMKAVPWFKIAQITIAAIRSVNKLHSIFVCGEDYANAVYWKINNDQLKNLVDPCDNIVYEAHCYFDADFSGRYLNPAGTAEKAYEYNVLNSKAGVQAIKPFVKWLKKNKKKGFVGEYGVPDDDPRWLPLLDAFLNYISANGINGAYWTAGPWWGNYRLSVEPRDGVDRPQMEVLQRYKTTAQ